MKYKTGKEAVIHYGHNTTRAPRAPVGDPFAQKIEPAGKYVIELPRGTAVLPGWEAGVLVFDSPLVLSWGSGGYHDADNWKQVLYRRYGKKGVALSRAIVADGYDGIITVDARGETSEIVDLSKWVKK